MNRILWADDEHEMLRPYIIYLNQKGYDVTTVPGGQDALDKVRKEQFDIVFLDEQMPGMSGLETLQLIKELRPELPVVMVTKSEEERIMEQAIGSKIADYLIKPVNPNQILMCLKRHIHEREIVANETNRSYREEFADIAWMIDTASTADEWMAVQRTLTKWELQLQDADSSMGEILLQQRKQANAAFAKFIARHYEEWFDAKGNLVADRPFFSPDIFRKEIFPLLDEGKKVFVVVIDNFRYDQWKAIQPLLSEIYTVQKEQMYFSILPTATQYARNAIFAGLMPAQIQQMMPQFWVDDDGEEGKNLNEKALLDSQLARFRRHETTTYYKINESDFCEKITSQLKSLHSTLNVAVINFIDMLSHARTDSKMMKELCPDEAAYRSLTLSWLRHSPTFAFLRRIAELGYTLVLTTDHGTVRVNNAVSIVGDRTTNTNLRYKVGKALNVQGKNNCWTATRPERIGLPCPNVSSSYIFATGGDFFAYPNNFNYYAQFFRDTFQHGGITLEEMLIPLVTLTPKTSN
ncbi:MAG: PglZ domain-containing protein [Paludibacteraceae bacterium]|nr:PglZ domain-containing protein [Paludibacteraceae bacterium]